MQAASLRNVIARLAIDHKPGAMLIILNRAGASTIKRRLTSRISRSDVWAVAHSTGQTIGGSCATTSAPSPAPAPQPAPAAKEFVVQLGAFSAAESAENFRARVYRELAWLSDAISVVPGGSLFRLHLGPYRTQEDARVMADRIQAELGLRPVVVAR